MEKAGLPAVTIVIPAYNHEDYVRSAIDSVLAQTFTDFELLIIDDGSSDSTSSIVDEYAGVPGVKVWHQENQGLSNTLNRGLEYARGRYFGFLPSDDGFLPEKLDFQVDYLDNHKGIAAVSSLQFLIDGEGKPIEDRAMEEWFSCEPADRSEFLQMLFERNFVAAPSVLVRTKILRELGGFDPECVFMQDYDLWFRLLKTHEMAVMPRKLIEYRWHGKNQTFRATDRTEKERARVLKKAVLDLSPEDIFPILYEDRRPEVVFRCRNILKERLGKYPPLNLDELLNIFDEKFALVMSSVKEERSAGNFFDEINLSSVSDHDGVKLNLLLEVTRLGGGGLEQVVYDLACGMAKRGHRVVVVCVEAGGILADKLKGLGIIVECLPSAAKQEAYRRLLLVYDIDLVNTHFSSFGPALAASMGIPVVAFVHNIYSWLPTDVMGEFRSVDRFVHRYVAVSEDAGQFLERQMNVPAGKIEVIPNGIDVSGWEDKKREPAPLTRVDLGINDEDYLFISVASISRVKGQDRVVAVLPELLERCPDVRVLFMGGGSDRPFSAYLKRLVDEVNVSHAVRFMDFTPDIHHYYRMADAFVLPSLIEGWSIAMLEAMFCGLPVIMTDIAGFRTVMEDHAAGIAIPAPYSSIEELDQSSLDRFSTIRKNQDNTRLLEAMGSFCTEREKWRLIGRANVDYVRNNFDIKKNLELCEKLFRDSVAGFSRITRHRNSVLRDSLDSMCDVIHSFGTFNRNARLLEDYTKWNRFLLDKLKETEDRLEVERKEFLKEKEELIAAGREIEGEKEKLLAENSDIMEEVRACNDELEQIVSEKKILSEETQRVKEELNAARLEIQNVREELSAEQKKVYDLDARLHSLQEWVDQIVSSTSWKITAPLRFAGIKSKAVFFYIKRSIYLLRHGGPAALVAAVKRHLSGRESGMPSPGTVENAGIVQCRALFDRRVVIFAIVPFDDVGGGQRSAQLARVLTARGIPVEYIYGYPRVNVNTGEVLPSKVRWPLMEHIYINDISTDEFLSSLSADDLLIFEAPLPSFYPYLKGAEKKGCRTVFELIDEWDSSLGGTWFDRGIMEGFFKESSIVVGTAMALVNILKDAGRDDALYLPNAANERIFDKYKRYPVPPEFKNSYAHKFLYFGSLYGDWFSWDCIREAATSCRDSLFLLIGEPPESVDLPDNVVFPGPKPIEMLPSYLAHCDAALLPFVPGKISDAVSPVKIFEYLFMEKPVIATPIPEIVNMPGVYLAETPAGFAALCRQLPASASGDNDMFIAQNSWACRADKLLPAGGRNDMSVVILIHNNRSIIGRCLETMILHGASDLREIIVVDNASSDGGSEYVRKCFPDVRVVKNPVNGCSSGRNLGASVATGDFLAFFDSDQWITSRSCFEEARAILTMDPDVGATGWSAGWFEKGRKDLGGIIVDYLPDRGNNVEMCENGYRTDIGYLATSGFFMERSLFEELGGFDENYDPTCFEDTDLSFQIKAAGRKIAYRDFTGIRHQPHQTTKSGTSSHQSLFEKNAAYMRKKWADRKEFFLDYTP